MKKESDYLNHIILLQAAGKREELIEYLGMVKITDHETDLGDRFYLEYANAAYKCAEPELGIESLNRIDINNNIEAQYLKVMCFINCGKYQNAFDLISEIEIKDHLYTSFTAIFVFLNFVTKILGIGNQHINHRERTEIIDLPDSNAALQYLIEVDATHPTAWYVLSMEIPTNRPELNEIDYYAIFSAFLGHGNLTYKRTFILLIVKAFGDSKDSDLFQRLLIMLIEEALHIRGRDFLDELQNEARAIFEDEELAIKIEHIVTSISNFHETNKTDIRYQGDGFLGNDLFMLSVLNLDSDEWLLGN